MYNKTNDTAVVKKQAENKTNAGDWRKRDPGEQREEEERDEARFVKMMSGNYTAIDNEKASGSVPVSISSNSSWSFLILHDCLGFRSHPEIRVYTAGSSRSRACRRQVRRYNCCSLEFHFQFVPTRFRCWGGVYTSLHCRNYWKLLIFEWWCQTVTYISAVML